MNYNFSDLDKYLDSILVKEEVPGYDCKVFFEGKEVYRRMGGYADKENKKPITADTMYFIYSASKVITCAAALHAYEEGYFNLTYPVWWYLPEFKDCLVKKYDENWNLELVPLTRHMCIQDLFSMCAGLNYDTNTEHIKEVVKATDGKAPTREIMKAIAKNSLEYQPRDRWGYSLCHDVLAGLVEVATGVRFSEYVQKNIFDKLGMKDSYYHINDEIKPRMAALYVHNSEDGHTYVRDLKNDYVVGTEYDSGGAGVITTLDDYSKFAYAMVNGGVGQNGERILSRLTIDLMRTNVLDEKRLKDFKSWDTNAEYGYGLGVRTRTDNGWGGNLCQVGEFGWDGAAGAMVSISPERKIAIIYFQHMLNSLGNIIHPKIKNIVNMALADKFSK